jgi:hypothetical protein
MSSEVAFRELARRSNDGIDVTLLWSPQTDRLFIAVQDEREGDRFRREISPADALDAFNHPYAYRKDPSCLLGLPA